ncbi:hypothetical protein PHJA_001228000 [Phtheirospermum japonicum]|uniref:Uncharacterized protein n=1 Tax=Phtheirospermum japonicum TaxID=374723 RepID=A0A830C9D9_9LAMI|nr:hypothetical protein PHJA_001228000 [Phtheirospermum japonicum]
MLAPTHAQGVPPQQRRPPRAASNCIFLTLSIRLFTSLVGFLFILLRILTIVGALSGCASASRAASSIEKFYGAHMEDDDVLILKLAEGLCVLMFCLEWVVLTLAFFLNYYAYMERRSINVNNNGYGARSGKVQDEEDFKSWPWPFQV